MKKIEELIKEGGIVKPLSNKSEFIKEVENRELKKIQTKNKNDCPIYSYLKNRRLFCQ